MSVVIVMLFLSKWRNPASMLLSEEDHAYSLCCSLSALRSPESGTRRMVALRRFCSSVTREHASRSRSQRGEEDFFKKNNKHRGINLLRIVADRQNIRLTRRILHILPLLPKGLQGGGDLPHRDRGHHWYPHLLITLFSRIKFRKFDTHD